MPRSPQGTAPTFSILIPTFNRSDLVCRAVKSCLAQSDPDFEVIVIDDGSSDDTAARIAAIEDDRVSYLFQENAGQAAAMNFGSERARARFLALLDSDDEFVPAKLETLRGAIEKQGAAAETTVFYSQLYFYRGDNNALVKPERAIASGESAAEYLFCAGGLMQTSTLVIPKALFDRVRFDGTLRKLTDLDLCLRLDAAGARFEMVPEPLSIWYDTDTGNRASYSTGTRQIDAWMESRRDLLDDRTRSGFQAHFLAHRIARDEPVRAVRVLADAVRRGTISPLRAGAILARGLMPGSYGRVRDALVSRRAGRRRQPFK